jgi:hypothetical protein
MVVFQVVAKLLMAEAALPLQQPDDLVHGVMIPWIPTGVRRHSVGCLRIPGDRLGRRGRAAPASPAAALTD